MIVGWQSDMTETNSAYDTNTMQLWARMTKEWCAWEWWISKTIGGLEWMTKNRDRIIWNHWGQKYIYPEDTWWLNCDFLSTSPSKKPLDTCWVILQRKSHFDHNVSRDQIVITFEKKTAQKAVGSFVKENSSFFHNFVHDVSTLNLSHSLRVLS